MNAGMVRAARVILDAADDQQFLGGQALDGIGLVVVGDGQDGIIGLGVLLDAVAQRHQAVRGRRVGVEIGLVPLPAPGERIDEIHFNTPCSKEDPM